MINNVKVLPVPKPEVDDKSFKAAFGSIRRESLEIVIVLPFQIPDNVIKGAVE
jgi:hypothetical protein